MNDDDLDHIAQSTKFGARPTGKRGSSAKAIKRMKMTGDKARKNSTRLRAFGKGGSRRPKPITLSDEKWTSSLRRDIKAPPTGGPLAFRRSLEARLPPFPKGDLSARRRGQDAIAGPRAIPGAGSGSKLTLLTIFASNQDWKNQAKSLISLAGVAGLEPATPGFGDRCS